MNRKPLVYLAIIVVVSAALVYVILDIEEANTCVVSGYEDGNGTVTGYGEYQRHTLAELKAVPDPGYEFVGWFDANSEMISWSETYSFWVYEDRRIDARFELITYEVKVILKGGSASVVGAGEYVPDSKVILKANPSYGYNFVSWKYNGTETTDATLSFDMPSTNAWVYCNLEGMPCEISLEKGPNVLSVTGAGTYKYGSKITLEAEAQSGYYISEWKEESLQIGVDRKYITYEVKGNAIITAYAQKYTGSSFKIKQEGYTDPYLFSCTDTFSPYSTDSWSAKGYTASNIEYALSCSYTEHMPGEWNLNVQYPEYLPKNNIVKVEIFHKSDYGDSIVSESSKMFDTYSWKYDLTKDGIPKSYESTIFLKLSETAYRADAEYSALWNRLYKTSNDWDMMVWKDFTIEKIATCIDEITAGCNDKERVQCALDFVTYTIEYKSDEENYGKSEYFATAYQTLYLRSGDCEDSSILFVTIAEYLGYDVYLISPPEHMAGGVKIGSFGGNFDAYPGLYYCETTGAGWKVGEIPPGYIGVSCDIVKVSIHS